MSQNPNDNCCGGTVTVDCCPNPVPKRLRADFTQGCAFEGPVILNWIESQGTWESGSTGCQGGENVRLWCEGTDCGGFRLQISGHSGCVYSIDQPTESPCNCGDENNNFSLTFEITQVGVVPGSCACCANGTSFQVTIEPED